MSSDRFPARLSGAETRCHAARVEESVFVRRTPRTMFALVRVRQNVRVNQMRDGEVA